ncbi:cytidylyltransferase domain-containing protein [Ferrimonas lipolytica]|nr:acylneuraminate cytidylyltransferase family protein [Ferrimonas lipolytica]
MKVVALITARGGSKGLPRKNVLPVGGKPLIGWTIQAALDCPQIERVFVSTEDAEIATISAKFGAEVIPRPSALATDTASSTDVVSHAISWLEEHRISCEQLALLQPTSPLRTANHLSEALGLYECQNAECVISVFEPLHTPVKSYIENADGSIEGLYSNEAPYMRRQDLPRAYQPNGAIYVFDIDEFKVNDHFPRKNTFAYVMPESESADVDTLADLLVVEKKIKELKI